MTDKDYESFEHTPADLDAKLEGEEEKFPYVSKVKHFDNSLDPTLVVDEDAVFESIAKGEGPKWSGVIRIVLTDGQVFAYDINAPDEDQLAHRAREHCHAIANGGYRSAGPDRFVLYPVWRISKIEFLGGTVFTKYQDRLCGT